MANLQHIADRVFRHVDLGRLPAAYASAMGALIDAYDDDPDFHAWADGVSGSAVDRLIARMAHEGAWNNPAWLQEYLRGAWSKEDCA